MILRKTPEVAKWLEEVTAIYNQGLYYYRQELFQARKENRKPDYSKIKLYDILKDMDCWKLATVDHPSKTAALRKVKDNWTSFYRACKAYWKDKGKFTGMPKPPKYLKNGKTAPLVFDKSRLHHRDFENHTLCFPKSKRRITIPKHVDMGKIRCITVVSYYGKVKLFISYDKETTASRLNRDNCVGIDIGVDNIVAITANNQKKSWIVKGGCVKSINQFYNKETARLKSILETVNKTKTSKRLQRMYMKRNQKLDYELHCISRKVIDLCLENDIGRIIIGHNNGWKQNSSLGRNTNQKFVQIPFNDLIWKIQYKAEENGIECVVVEESYTSKTDHMCGEEMVHHDSYSGKRIQRGLFRSSCGRVLNADVNGAIGILRKANALPDGGVAALRNRGDVVSPVVLKYKP